MGRTVTIAPICAAEPGEQPPKRPRANGPLRTLVAMVVVALAFAAVAIQLIRLAVPGYFEMSASMSETVGQIYARPDIVDRNGRLLATDVEVYSLFADPAHVIDRDEVVEKLAGVFPDLNRDDLFKDLSDRSRRFVWIRRGLSPNIAQRVHNLGLPGLDFRRELRRAYPGGMLAGHVLGYVNIDNKGVSGIERYIDDKVGVEAVQGAALIDRAPVRLSIDMGVQHAVEVELEKALKEYKARGAAGVVLDVDTGEVVASASLPQVDPARPSMSLDATRIDKIASSTFELGSIFKTVTVATALEAGVVTPATVLDVRNPISAGGYTIKDLHSAGRPLSVAEVFIHSSNVGAAMLARKLGTNGMRTALRRLQLLGPMETEMGAIAPPQMPERWGEVENMTISYGHGLAVAPLQFAAAAATLINGGSQVFPTFIKRPVEADRALIPLISAQTSAQVRELMRRNVTDAHGTGKRAAVAGYEVGGKTGTAEIPGPGGYRKKKVISSFLAGFPMSHPKYLVLVLLFEPSPTAAARGEVLAALNAAPTTGRIISRIGPMLGVSTASSAPGRTGMAFDGSAVAKYETR